MSADQFRRRRNPNPNPFDDDTVDNDPYNSRSGRSGTNGGGGGSSSRRSSAVDPSNSTATAATADPPHDPLLDLYERRLHEDVDSDFFHDPEEFQALNRVIDIIGAEIDNSGGNITPGSEIGTNFSHLPGYQSIQNQQRIVEEAIEHMAVKHCADLNSSVAAVGRMSRQFDEAKLRVRNLRRQVRDVKDSLRLGELGDIPTVPSNDPASSANPNEPSNTTAAAKAAAEQAGASARSLRELWLKKLECEAVLSLLRKLEILRRAPSGFDSLIRPLDGGPCKIGAAVVVLSEALSIMFSDDVAQVQAFDRIMEQLMTRKQRAEEILWGTLVDVLYRHGDKQNKEEERRRRERMERRARAMEAAVARGEASATAGMSTIAEYSDEDESNSYTQTCNSFEDELSTKSGTRGGDSIAGGSTGANTATPSITSALSQFKRMVGRAILESEIDLEGDELRCLEEPAAWGSQAHSQHAHLPASHLYPEQALPRYTDPVLAIRILVECLTKMKRLDDVEQYLSEGMDREIRQVAAREQAKTYARLERRRGRGAANLSSLGEGDGDGSGGEGARRGGGGGDDADNLKEFRIHLNNLLKAFEGVMTRFLHLSQILRHKICSDPILEKMCPSYPIPSSALYTVLVNAELAMQREIKLFISACIAESDKPKDKRKQARLHNAMHMDQSQLDVESGIFSLGITSSLGGNPMGVDGWKKSRANIVDLPPDQFVSNVLFPRSNVDPEVRHALTFRRSISRWTHEVSEGRRELAICSGEDTNSPMYRNNTMEEGALVYMDNIIQRTLLPEMQDEAVNAVIHFLERHDAFDPIANDVFTRYPHHTVQVEAEMSVACQALYTSTRPIFMALHRLPKGGDMYLSLVTMLEHAMLTFISRMKQRVGEICQGKAAFSLLEDQRGNPTPLSQFMERRNAFTLLQRIYNDEDDVNDPTGAVEPTTRVGGILPLAPPEGDTSPRKTGKLSGADGRGPFEREVAQIDILTKFSTPLKFERSTLCNDVELMKAACLANSLLRVASLLDGQLRSRAGGWEKSSKIKAIRDLQSAIKTIRYHGLRVSKFCRLEVLIQTAKRMSEICMSSVLQAEDAIRLPSCVNNLGEYLTASSDNLREAGGNAIAAFSFSSLEQYIPFYLMHAARIAAGGPKPITMNGIESLDRTGSVLYRDLKGATSFENSFWDEEAAANSFEQSAIFISLMEISLNELEGHYRSNPTQFSDEDYQLMFAFTGPRRRGDARRFNLLKSKMKTERRGRPI
ncbi:hypothetical protein ACHAXR_011102 [Thalassiosira sp. AJA248-18]